ASGASASKASASVASVEAVASGSASVASASASASAAENSENAVPAPTAPQAGTETLFSMDGLMKVMGRDDKGRAVLFKMVRGALDNGMGSLEQAETALSEGRLSDAARLFHGLRGSVGVLGAKRLITVTQDAEAAISEGCEQELPQRFADVRTTLEQTLEQARAWLRREQGDV
ncbi:Hpt domain-containing protein, partial [Oxalobacteraceae bacterium]|nr:Hpt domain-containing protein [Oxalobacteraceae bacterium]